MPSTAPFYSWSTVTAATTSGSYFNLIPAAMLNLTQDQVARIDKVRGEMSLIDFVNAALEDALFWAEDASSPAQAA